MPKKGIIQRFLDSTLRTKLTVSFLLVVIFPMVLIAVISEKLIARKIHDEIQKATEQNLNAAWIQYYIRAEQMKFGMLQATEVVERAILRNDKTFLRNKMIHWKDLRPYVDVWTIVDREGRVVVRLNSDKSGDIFDLNGIVMKTLLSGEPVISTEIMPREMLLKEGEKLVDEIAVPVVIKNDKDEYNPGYMTETDALMLTVVVPVKDESRVIGAIITGDILNRDNFVPDTIAQKIPGALATITKNGVRIATTMSDEIGRRAIGSNLSTKVMSAINKGENYTGIVPISGEKYIASVAPIKDIKGNTIGSLSVRVPEARFIVIHKSNRLSIFFVTLLGVLFAIGTAIFVTSRITRPLRLFVHKARDAASGNMDVMIPVAETGYTKDETSLLARSFNEMVREIKERNREREVYLKELEKKTEDLFALNEKLQSTNQELEVALEEAQSQQEELQSANEELTILNEELERKTNELFDANLKITEEEEEIKGVRDQLELIYNGIKDYILLLAPDCTILEVNRSFLDAYGMREEDVIGKKCYSLIYDSKEIMPECDITRGADIRKFQRQRVVTKDNKALEIYVFPVCDNMGNLINRIEYIRDVTVETMLRDQLIQAEKLSALGEILSGIAHELNNPLTGVIGYCELIYETTQDANLKDQLKKINDSALRCKKIIENLLAFARQHRIEKQYTNINETIRQAIELKTYQLKIDNIDVVMELNDNIPYTMIDPYTIQQVFLNIINNAHMAMVDKGGHGRLTIKSEHKDGVIKISFSDTGTGIPAANLKRIFDPFFTTREVGKGTGLGLSVSYGIIKEHKGEIYAESRPGDGATFVIELPVISPETVVTEVKGVSESIEKVLEGSKKRILLIDDEPSLLDLMKAIVEGMGYEVDTASDASLAIEKVRHKDYDLIVSDIKMPNMDGKNFYKVIEALRPELAKRIIFTTGDVVDPETQKFIKSSGWAYIEKPFTPAELKRLVSEFFTAHEGGVI